MDRAYALVVEAEEGLKAKPPRMTRQRALENEKTAKGLLLQATATLDLSLVPEAHRKAASIEAVLKLKEVLDRTVLPNLENVPDASMVLAVQQRENQPSARAVGPFRWRYPNTEIEIVEIVEGDRRGEFLFSAGTVSRIGDFYDRVRQLPYRTEITRAQES